MWPTNSGQKENVFTLRESNSTPTLVSLKRSATEPLPDLPTTNPYLHTPKRQKLINPLKIDETPIGTSTPIRKPEFNLQPIKRPELPPIQPPRISNMSSVAKATNFTPMPSAPCLPDFDDDEDDVL